MVAVTSSCQSDGIDFENGIYNFAEHKKLGVWIPKTRYDLAYAYWLISWTDRLLNQHIRMSHSGQSRLALFLRHKVIQLSLISLSKIP
jgi:hypothetical protein